MSQHWKTGLLLLLAGCGASDPNGSVDSPAGGASSEVQPSARFVLHGRVLDPWSTPVAGAEVRALLAGQVEQEQALANGISGAQGDYELVLPGPGPFALFAREPGAGYDALQSAPLKPGVRNEAPVMRLAGEGRLAGRLVDAAGEPIALAKVIVYSRELLHQELLGGQPALSLDDFPLGPPLLESAHFEAGRGFQYGEDETDSEGRFALKGLVPGDYLIFSPALGTRSWLDLERRWWATGNQEIELSSSLCTLEVAVGSDGLPGNNAELLAQRRRLGPIEVFATIGSGANLRPLLERKLQPYAAERNIFLLEPGDYVVRAVTYPAPGTWGATMNVEGRVHLAVGETQKHYVLEFPEPTRPTGRLRVKVELPPAWDAPEDFHLFSPWTARELECSEYTPYPSMLYDHWLDMPEGEYLIGLIPFDDFVGHPEVMEFGACYRRITIQSGLDVEVTLRATFGGRFRLALGAPRFVLGGDLEFPAEMARTDQDRVLQVFAQTFGATLTVVREGGGPALKLRMIDPLGRLGEERKSMLPGEAFENLVPLEPGRYVLWAHAPGFGSASTALEIRPHERTPVRAQLEWLTKN